MKYPNINLKSLHWSAFLSLALLVWSNVYCQDSSLNLYSNWTYYPNDVITHIDIGDAQIGYSGLSVSYKKINQKLRFNEFELKTGLRFPSNDQASQSRVYNHIRYELGKQKPFGSSKKNNFEYGGGVRLFHFCHMTNSKVPTSFTNSLNITGIGIAFLPGINYHLNDNFYVQFKAILLDLTFDLYTTKTNRTDIPINLRNNGSFNMNLRFIQGLRFGIGYAIGR